MSSIIACSSPPRSLGGAASSASGTPATGPARCPAPPGPAPGPAGAPGRSSARRRAARGRRRAGPARRWWSSCRRRRSRSRPRSGSPGRRAARRRRGAGELMPPPAPTPWATSASASSYSVPRSTPSTRFGSSSSGAGALAQPGHRRRLGLDPHRVLDGLGDQPVDHLRAPGATPAEASPERIRAGVHPAVRGRRHGAVRQPLRAHPVDDHRARPQVRGLELGDRLQGLGHRQVLQQRHQVHGGQRRVQQPHHALALAVDRAAAREVGHRLGDVEEADDAGRSAGRRARRRRRPAGRRGPCGRRTPWPCR